MCDLDDTLRRVRGQQTAREISDKLSCTHNAVVRCTWTDDMDQTLRSLWGHTTASEIGKKLGKSKSAIIGRAHRIGIATKNLKEKFPVIEPKKYRDYTELKAWQSLLELVEDDCQIIDLTPAMKRAIVKVENLMKHFSKIEEAAITIARPLYLISHQKVEEWSCDEDEIMDKIWGTGPESIEVFVNLMKQELPSVFMD